MTKRIVILGGGTGGTLTANRLHRHFKHHRAGYDEVEITVVDRDDHHMYQPGLLFVPFGLAQHSEIVRPRKRSTPERHRVHRVRHRPGGSHQRHGVPRERPRAPLRRARHRHRRSAGARRDRGPHRPRLEREGLHVLRHHRRHRPRDGARRVRGRRPGRQRRRHADQVPRRPAGVLLPGRLVLHRARHPRQGADHLRDTARRRVHQAGRLGHAVGAAGGEGHRPGHRVQHRRGCAATRATSWSATTAAKCRSTWPSSSRCTAAPTTSVAARASATT